MTSFWSFGVRGTGAMVPSGDRLLHSMPVSRRRRRRRGRLVLAAVAGVALALGAWLGVDLALNGRALLQVRDELRSAAATTGRDELASASRRAELARQLSSA